MARSCDLSNRTWVLSPALLDTLSSTNGTEHVHFFHGHFSPPWLAPKVGQLPLLKELCLILVCLEKGERFPSVFGTDGFTSLRCYNFTRYLWEPNPRSGNFGVDLEDDLPSGELRHHTSLHVDQHCFGHARESTYPTKRHSRPQRSSEVPRHSSPASSRSVWCGAFIFRVEHIRPNVVDKMFVVSARSRVLLATLLCLVRGVDFPEISFNWRSSSWVHARGNSPPSKPSLPIVLDRTKTGENSNCGAAEVLLHASCLATPAGACRLCSSLYLSSRAWHKFACLCVPPILFSGPKFPVFARLLTSTPILRFDDAHVHGCGTFASSVPPCAVSAEVSSPKDIWPDPSRDALNACPLRLPQRNCHAQLPCPRGPSELAHVEFRGQNSWPEVPSLKHPSSAARKSPRVCAAIRDLSSLAVLGNRDSSFCDLECRSGCMPSLNTAPSANAAASITIHKLESNAHN